MWLQVTLAEYIPLLATFFAVIAQGLEMGIAVGVVLATMYFAFEYAKVGA
jgi:MFS superfamily sulfate permease-like transporter